MKTVIPYLLLNNPVLQRQLKKKKKTKPSFIYFLCFLPLLCDFLERCFISHTHLSNCGGCFCQLDGVWNHQGDMPWNVSVREFPERFNRRWAWNLLWIWPWVYGSLAWGLGLNRNEKVNWAWTCISLCFLMLKQQDHLPYASATLPPPWYTHSPSP